MPETPRKQSNRPRQPPVDVLSDVLATIRLHGQVYGTLDLLPPWGVSAAPHPAYVFHIVARGEGWFTAGDRPPIHVSTGDVLLLAPRTAHVLRDAPRSPVIPFTQAIAANRPLDDPRAMQIVCGGFHVDDESVLAALPPVIHTHELASDASPWLAQTVKLLVFEACHGLPGGTTVVGRVCDALFVYVIRSVLAKLPDTASWLRALVTPNIGEAVRLIHQEPSRAWSVASLASEVGMSRSAFADRFHEVVGDTPMQYLIGWRVRKAASLLRGGEVSIAEVASRVGYQSDVAFAKAFKRAMGMTPGAFRGANATPTSPSAR